MAISSQLQTLTLGPRFDETQTHAQTVSPQSGTQFEIWLQHDAVERPHVDEMEELREQLDGEGSVDATSS